MPQGGMILNPSAWPTPQLFIIHQRSDFIIHYSFPWTFGFTARFDGTNAVPFGKNGVFFGGIFAVFKKNGKMEKSGSP